MSVTEQLDHSAVALSRLAAQYEEAEKFQAFIAAITAQCTELEAAFFKIAEISDIDLAGGVNLDVIGALVGQSRIIHGTILPKFFGFDSTTGALTYGDANFPNKGGRLWDENEPYTASSVLADPEYRTLIRARIVRNRTDGSLDDVLTGASYMFGGVPVVVEDDFGGMAFGIAIGKPLTLTEIALLQQDILPRPAGVRIAWMGWYEPGKYLGFEGQPGATGFPEEGDTSHGFLMEEF